MEQIVSITKQGQLTIPKSFRDVFGITGRTKAVLRREGSKIIVQPKKNFWKLSGALHSDIRLSDKDLRGARKAFSQKWAKDL